MKTVAVLGSGPAAFMVADVVSAAGHRVTIFEKKKGPGRKLLIAGSSGLNITHSAPPTEFYKNYSGSPSLWKALLKDFSPQDWIAFLEGLGLSTFQGTSGRYFVQEMKASKLLRAWVGRLTERGVQFRYGWECTGFTRQLSLEGRGEPVSEVFDAICFCLGGGSYEPNEVPLRWPQIFINKNLRFVPFLPSNVGYQIEWPPAFLKECEGLPLKNICLTSEKGSRLGDMVITHYGLEGTPVYFVGQPGALKIDLKPDLSVEQVLVKCRAVKENFSPLRRMKKQLALCPAALGLLFHATPREVTADLKKLVHHLKNFPVQFLKSQSLTEAISSAGGLSMSELTDEFMLHQYRGVFAAGEMLDWDAPTGGFLIQGCVSQGYRAGHGLLKFLRNCDTSQG